MATSPPTTTSPADVARLVLVHMSPWHDGTFHTVAALAAGLSPVGSPPMRTKPRLTTP
jgi:hypothetical protein